MATERARARPRMRARDVADLYGNATSTLYSWRRTWHPGGRKLGPRFSREHGEVWYEEADVLRYGMTHGYLDAAGKPRRTNGDGSAFGGPGNYG